MNKSELRKIMSVKRNSLTDEEKIYKSRKIFENLLDTANLADVSCIFIFVSYRSECDTTPIIDYCIDNGIKVAVPRVNGDKMDFYVIRDKSELSIGSYGILEPVTDTIIYPDEKSLIIMPGLVFDTKGNRIGYGGGYYDKYISEYNLGLKAAICFDFQIVEENIIEVEDTDVVPDMIITDSRNIDVAKLRS